MRALPILAFLLFVPTLYAQEPTLTVDVCRADAKTLSAEMRLPKANEASYFVWSLRAEEMSKCQDIDRVVAGNLESIQRGVLYIGLENAARVAMIGELDNFIHRHGLQKQFIDDDDAGLR